MTGNRAPSSGKNDRAGIVVEAESQGKIVGTVQVRSHIFRSLRRVVGPMELNSRCRLVTVCIELSTLYRCLTAFLELEIDVAPIPESC